MKNILPEDVPALSEDECTLVNLYRTLSEAKKQAVMKLIFSLALNGGKSCNAENVKPT